jgi:cell division protein FtsL
MAVIGARPATGIGILGRRTRLRPRTVPQQRRRASAARRRRETASISGIVVAIAAAALLGLFYLSQSSHVLATGYEIDALRAQLADAQAQQAQLIYRIGEARSPAVIERAARGALQLRPLPVDAIGFAQPAEAGSTSTAIAIDQPR